MDVNTRHFQETWLKRKEERWGLGNGEMGATTSFLSQQMEEGFLGGSVVKNPPASAGDTGSIPGPGKSHMPWSY